MDPKGLPTSVLDTTTSQPQILIACEFSGVVRDAFIEAGFPSTYSCDLWPSGGIHKENHLVADVEPLLQRQWDLVIAHPPCTYIANSGVRHLNRGRNLNRMLELVEGCRFFTACLNANSLRICVENPIPHQYAMKYLKVPYTQIIQPYEFGHGETKATCLWLKGLPPLTSTIAAKDRQQRILNMNAKGLRRQKIRSITYPGIAKAIVEQWGPLLREQPNV